VDDTVSGKMTATLPFPAEATDLSWDIALNELFRSLTEIDEELGLLAELEDVADGLLELLELQAAMSRAALSPAAASPALFVGEDTNIPRLIRRDRPGFGLGIREQIRVRPSLAKHLLFF